MKISLIFALLLAVLATAASANEANAIPRSDKLTVVGCDVTLDAVAKIKRDQFCGHSNASPCEGVESFAVLFLDMEDDGTPFVCRAYDMSLDLSTGSYAAALLLDGSAESSQVQAPLPSPKVPREVSLSNFPNPFNATSTIQYSLPFDGSVKLAVYNLLGEAQAILQDGPVVAGSHSTSWDGTNAASGQYFIQLKVDGRVLMTKKALLLK